MEAVTYSADEAHILVVKLTVDRIGLVCDEYWRTAYGISKYTWNRLLTDAQAGRLRTDQMWHDTGEHGYVSFDHSDASAPPVVMDETIEWWVMWPELEDQMPNKPVILHRQVFWPSFCDDEYVKDMVWWGTTKPLSKTRWISLRDEGLKRLSTDIYDAQSDLVTPVRMRKLQERAKHSNFVQCNDCAEIKEGG
eukprot:2580190-Pleurochrysis_carterae.AAC.1